MKTAQDFYGVFLIVEMAREMGIIDKELETDLTWEQASRFYDLFEGSKFDVDTQGEYMCIHDFLTALKTKIAKDDKSNQVIITGIEIDVTGQSAVVCGNGFPMQDIHFDSFGDWRTIRDEDGKALVDIQIDFDEDFQIQYVNLLWDIENEDTCEHGHNWHSVDRAAIEVVNCGGYVVTHDGNVKGRSETLKGAIDLVRNKDNYFITPVGLKIEPIGEDEEKPVPSEMTKRFMEIFYVKYAADGEFEDDETITELNRFFKNIR